jgi:hypothetical protein
MVSSKFRRWLSPRGQVQLDRQRRVSPRLAAVIKPRPDRFVWPITAFRAPSMVNNNLNTPLRSRSVYNPLFFGSQISWCDDSEATRI